MKLLLLSFTFLIVSCGISHNQDVIYRNQKDTISLKQEADSIKNNSPLTNENLWQKIIQNPDSVPVFIFINDSLHAELIISGELDSSYYDLKTIKVFFSNGSKQQLKIKGGIMVWHESDGNPYLKFEDLNFDGSKDLNLFDNAGATGNFWYGVWLFDRAKKRFSYSLDFSSIPSPKVNTQSKQILSFYHQSECEERFIYFNVEDNKTKPVKYIYGELRNCDLPDGCDCITLKKELINDNWKQSPINDEEFPNYDSIYSPRK
jgi:hypothetical protein